MTTLDLTDAHEKLRWAKHHFGLVEPEILAFEKRDNHRFSFKVNAETGEYRFYVHDLELVDPDWGLIIGDCLHNARTALDYLMVRLWSLVTGTPPDKIYDVTFPIFSPRLPSPAEQPDVDKAFLDARRAFKKATVKFAEQPAFSGYLARIEELQPFNSGNQSIWGWQAIRALPIALERLGDLDNADKHRVPHIAWTAIDMFAERKRIQNSAPADFVFLGGSTVAHSLENDAEVGTVQFAAPLPRKWKPSQVDMHAAFPFRISLHQLPVWVSALNTLRLCIWGVESVLAIFEPVFIDAYGPPLPVTEIAEPDHF